MKTKAGKKCERICRHTFFNCNVSGKRLYRNMEDRGHLIFVQFVRNSLLLHSARPERHAVFAARNAAAVARQPADQNEAQKKRRRMR